MYKKPKNIPCNLVAQRLAGDDGHLLTDLLVDVEVITQTGVVLLDDHPSRLLHCLGPHAPLRRRNSAIKIAAVHATCL